MPSALRPQADLDFTEPEINRDPWPHFEELRELGPAVWNPPSNSWILTSYEDVRAVLRNEADYAPAAELYAEIFGDPTVLGADNPRHAELRGIWGPALLRGAMKSWVELVAEICDRHLDPALDRIRDGEVVDLVSHLRMIPTELIARMIGVPAEDCGLFTEWGQCIVYQFDAYSAPDSEDAAELREAGTAATKALNDYCGEQLEMRRRAGRADDLLGVMATTEVPMSDQEKRAYITMFIEGAQDTTTKFNTSTLAALAQHPEQRTALAKDREFVAQALEEVMRWQGPVSLDLRIARRPGLQIGDVTFAEGDQISPSLAAANRDPSRWSDPHSFDIFRPAQAHLGFGFGTHGCMGINLARLVATTVLNKVLDAIPEYRLATDTLEYGSSFLIRGPLSLPLSR
jgi:cytochrome P450